MTVVDQIFDYENEATLSQVRVRPPRRARTALSSHGPGPLCPSAVWCHHSAFRQTPPHHHFDMLDSFEILTTSGVVLWSKSYAPVSAKIINSLIKEVFIEDTAGLAGAASAVNDVSAARNPTFKKERYTLKWTTAKDLGLIFVVRLPHCSGGA